MTKKQIKEMSDYVKANPLTLEEIYSSCKILIEQGEFDLSNKILLNADKFIKRD